MALIPPFFIDCVVAIGTQNEKGEKQWIGTGFLVGKHNKDITGQEKRYHTFLITNKHVIADVKSIIVRFNPKGNEPAKDYTIDLTNKASLSIAEHPTPEIDVVAIYINPSVLNRDQARFAFFKLDEHALYLSDMKEQSVSEGDFVYVLGFPMGIVAPDRQYVIIRSGVIARLRDVVDQKSREFLIDANVFPGNSGGPVILKPEFVKIDKTSSHKNASLIGIITSYVTYRDVAISQQTNQPRVIFEENSGLAVVVPADFIRETVEEAFKDLVKKASQQKSKP